MTLNQIVINIELNETIIIDSDLNETTTIDIDLIENEGLDVLIHENSISINLGAAISHARREYIYSPEELRHYCTTMNLSYYRSQWGQIILSNKHIYSMMIMCNGYFYQINCSWFDYNFPIVPKDIALCAIDRAIILAPYCKRISKLMRICTDKYSVVIPTLLEEKSMLLAINNTYDELLVPFVRGKPCPHLFMLPHEMIKITQWRWYQPVEGSIPRIFHLLLGEGRSNIVKIMRNQTLLINDAWDVVEEFMAIDIVIFQNSRGVENILPRGVLRKR